MSLQGCVSSASMTEGRASEVRADDKVKSRFARGLFLAAAGRYDEALALYRTLEADAAPFAALYFAKARLFVETGQLEPAIAAAEQAVSMEPKHVYYVRLLGSLYHDAGRYEDALGMFLSQKEITPDDPKALSMLADAYLALDRPQDALRVFERLRVLDPFNEHTLAHILWIELKLNHYKEAIEVLQTMMEQGSGNDKLMLTLGELYLQTGEVERALVIFHDIVADDASFLPGWIALFEALIETGEVDELEQELTVFFGHPETELDAALDLVRLFMLRSDIDSAYLGPVRFMAGRMLADYPDNRDVRFTRGLIHARDGEYRKAREFFLPLVASDPAYVKAWEEIASSYVAEGEFHHALYTFRQAREALRRPSYRLLVLEGYALYRSELMEAAFEVLGDAQLREGDAQQPAWLRMQAAITMALVSEKTGREEQSLDAYSRVLDIDPHNTLALNNLAYMLAERNERLPEALAYARKAVQTEPGNPVFLDTLGWVYFKLGNYEQALLYLERAVATGFSDPEIIEHLEAVREK
ncbi:tetratricopeptide repeat protein [Prosthecochloris sp. CIB 2401]|uniref:tetratricopeptide repeat protein n=1 Tax=Prosthecochloris sp. CIB 2401 TaxID=1868325 RepID=UPI0013905D6E|nr:tetratricopeptide repeat protein [Prosthecochloris sp. CIB 2401]